MLNTAPNLPAPDDFYQALIDAHRGLTEAESHAMNARLILLLANHVGDTGVLLQAIAAARPSPIASQSPSPAGGRGFDDVVPSGLSASEAT